MAITKSKSDAEQGDEQPAERVPVGTVVRLPNHHDRYALVVGYSDPVEADTGRGVHAHDGHPLLLDLHGAPREHQSGIERL